jgi:hypothetical protein
VPAGIKNKRGSRRFFMSRRGALLPAVLFTKSVDKSLSAFYYFESKSI